MSFFQFPSFRIVCIVLTNPDLFRFVVFSYPYIIPCSTGTSHRGSVPDLSLSLFSFSALCPLRCSGAVSVRRWKRGPFGRSVPGLSPEGGLWETNSVLHETDLLTGFFRGVSHGCLFLLFWTFLVFFSRILYSSCYGKRYSKDI